MIPDLSELELVIHLNSRTAIGKELDSQINTSICLGKRLTNPNAIVQLINPNHQND